MGLGPGQRGRAAASGGRAAVSCDPAINSPRLYGTAGSLSAVGRGGRYGGIARDGVTGLGQMVSCPAGRDERVVVIRPDHRGH